MIFRVLSLTGSLVNLQQIHNYTSHHTLNAQLSYLGTYPCQKIAVSRTAIFLTKICEADPSHSKSLVMLALFNSPTKDIHSSNAKNSMTNYMELPQQRKDTWQNVAQYQRLVTQWLIASVCQSASQNWLTEF